MLKRRAIAYAAIGCIGAGVLALWFVTVSVAREESAASAQSTVTTERGLPVAEEEVLPAGWSCQFVLDGALFWKDDIGLLEAPDGAAASPLWYDRANEAFFLFEGDDVGWGLVCLRDRHGIDIGLLLRWYPTLADAVRQVDAVMPNGEAPGALSGVVAPDGLPGSGAPDDAWGAWMLASNAMMLPDRLAGQEPYPGWGEE